MILRLREPQRSTSQPLNRKSHGQRMVRRNGYCSGIALRSVGPQLRTLVLISAHLDIADTSPRLKEWSNKSFEFHSKAAWQINKDLKAPRRSSQTFKPKKNW